MMTEHCLTCDTEQPRHRNPETNKLTWLDIPIPTGAIRSFCSEPCRDAFELLTDDQKQTRLFGRTDFAEDLMQDIAEGRMVQDTPAIGNPLYVLDFNLTVLLDEGAPFASLPHSKCPKPTHNTRSFGDLNYCLDCGFVQPTGWRQVVAR